MILKNSLFRNHGTVLKIKKLKKKIVKEIVLNHGSYVQLAIIE